MTLREDLTRCLFTMALPPCRGLLEATTTVLTVLIFNRNGSNTVVVIVVVVGESVAVWSTWLCECSVCKCPCVLCECFVLVSV